MDNLVVSNPPSLKIGHKILSVKQMELHDQECLLVRHFKDSNDIFFNDKKDFFNVIY